MSEDERPNWKHKIPEEKARWIRNYGVNSIRHNYKMTSEDTADYWLELRTHDEKHMLTVPTNFLEIWEVEFIGWSQSLIGFSKYSGIEETIEAMDKYDKKHRDELAAYKRLKKKYEGHLIADVDEDTVGDRGQQLGTN